MQEIHGMSTSRRHAMSSGHGFTDRTLQQHSATSSIHVESRIKGILWHRRVSTLQSKGFKRGQGHSLIAFATV
eukprot:2236926-Amphidinium_carterae.2